MKKMVVFLTLFSILLIDYKANCFWFKKLGCYNQDASVNSLLELVLSAVNVLDLPITCGTNCIGTSNSNLFGLRGTNCPGSNCDRCLCGSLSSLLSNPPITNCQATYGPLGIILTYAVDIYEFIDSTTAEEANTTIITSTSTQPSTSTFVSTSNIKSSSFSTATSAATSTSTSTAESLTTTLTSSTSSISTPTISTSTPGSLPLNFTVDSTDSTIPTSGSKSDKTTTTVYDSSQSYVLTTTPFPCTTLQTTSSSSSPCLFTSISSTFETTSIASSESTSTSASTDATTQTYTPTSTTLLSTSTALTTPEISTASSTSSDSTTTTASTTTDSSTTSSTTSTASLTTFSAISDSTTTATTTEASTTSSTNPDSTTTLSTITPSSITIPSSTPEFTTSNSYSTSISSSSPSTITTSTKMTKRLNTPTATSKKTTQFNRNTDNHDDYAWKSSSPTSTTSSTSTSTSSLTSTSTSTSLPTSTTSSPTSSTTVKPTSLLYLTESTVSSTATTTSTLTPIFTTTQSSTSLQSSTTSDSSTTSSTSSDSSTSTSSTTSGSSTSPISTTTSTISESSTMPESSSASTSTSSLSSATHLSSDLSSSFQTSTSTKQSTSTATETTSLSTSTASTTSTGAESSRSTAVTTSTSTSTSTPSTSETTTTSTEITKSSSISSKTFPNTTSEKGSAASTAFPTSTNPTTSTELSTSASTSSPTSSSTTFAEESTTSSSTTSTLFATSTESTTSTMRLEKLTYTSSPTSSSAKITDAQSSTILTSPPTTTTQTTIEFYPSSEATTSLSTAAITTTTLPSITPAAGTSTSRDFTTSLPSNSVLSIYQSVEALTASASLFLQTFTNEATKVSTEDSIQLLETTTPLFIPNVEDSTTESFTSKHVESTSIPTGIDTTMFSQATQEIQSIAAGTMSFSFLEITLSSIEELTSKLSTSETSANSKEQTSTASTSTYQQSTSPSKAKAIAEISSESTELALSNIQQSLTTGRSTSAQFLTISNNTIESSNIATVESTTTASRSTELIEKTTTQSPDISVGKFPVGQLNTSFETAATTLTVSTELQNQASILPLATVTLTEEELSTETISSVIIATSPIVNTSTFASVQQPLFMHTSLQQQSLEDMERSTVTEISQTSSPSPENNFKSTTTIDTKDTQSMNAISTSNKAQGSLDAASAVSADTSTLFTSEITVDPDESVDTLSTIEELKPLSVQALTSFATTLLSSLAVPDLTEASSAESTIHSQGSTTTRIGSNIQANVDGTSELSGERISTTIPSTSTSTVIHTEEGNVKTSTLIKESSTTSMSTEFLEHTSQQQSSAQASSTFAANVIPFKEVTTGVHVSEPAPGNMNTIETTDLTTTPDGNVTVHILSNYSANSNYETVIPTVGKSIYFHASSTQSDHQINKNNTANTIWANNIDKSFSTVSYQENVTLKMVVIGIQKSQWKKIKNETDSNTMVGSSSKLPKNGVQIGQVQISTHKSGPALGIKLGQKTTKNDLNGIATTTNQAGYRTTTSKHLSRTEEIILAIEKVALPTVHVINCVWIIITTAVTIVMLALFRSFSYMRYLQMAQDITLCIAHIFILFLCNRVDLEMACNIVPVIMQFLYLSLFLLLLAESVQSYILVTNVLWDGSLFTLRLVYIVSFGMPATITVFTSWLGWDHLTSELSCWLNLDHWVKLATSVPLLTTVAITLIVLEAIGQRTPYVVPLVDTGQITDAKFEYTKAHFASWLLGIVSFYQPSLGWFSLMLIFNIILGWFILTFHLLGNEKVRKFLKRIFQKLCKRRKAKIQNTKSSKDKK